MKQIVKLAILGGTGKSGKYVVQQLLNQQIHFKVLVRNPLHFQIKSPFIEVIEGSVRDYGQVLSLVTDCDAVISTLGQPQGEPSIFSTATKNVIRAMEACHITRYILTTGLNVDTPLDHKGPKTKSATDWMKANYPETTTDKQTEFELLLKSQLDWTLVRLPLIELTAEYGQVLVSLEDCPGDKISAADLAHFLIEQLSDDSNVRKAPFIANA